MILERILWATLFPLALWTFGIILWDLAVG